MYFVKIVFFILKFVCNILFGSKSALVQEMAWCQVDDKLFPQIMPTQLPRHIYVSLGLDEFDTLRLRQNGRHFADHIFKYIFLNANIWTLFKISLWFVPNFEINNIPALVQIMAWHRPGDKPLSEPMTVRLPMHICITEPQWINGSVNSWL